MSEDYSNPTVRLAATTAMLGDDKGAKDRYPMHKDYKKDGPTVRLAHNDGAQGDGALAGKEGKGEQLAPEHAPAILVSYYYLEPFLKNRASYRYRDWVMDSGAFSAHNSGAVIDLNQYVDKCLELMATDPTMTEVFALDVVGDHEASIRNTEEMWRQGVPAIPCYHAGEPEEALLHIAKTYPKIALGGVALERADKKLRWAEQCFARIWPKKVHGFAFCSPKAILGLPFHSTDATSWEIGPCAFGNWEVFGSMSVRGSSQDLRSQVYHYLELEQLARVRWAAQMAELERLEPSPAVLGSRPTVRLALNGNNSEEPPERVKSSLFNGPAAVTPTNSSSSERIDCVIGSKEISLPPEAKPKKPKQAKQKEPATDKPKEPKKPAEKPKPRTSADLPEMAADDPWANWRPS